MHLKTNPEHKIESLEGVIRKRLGTSNSRLTFVLTNGCFDVLHRGHIEYLYASSQTGDFLAVAINSDYSVRQLKGDSRPINTQKDRAYLIAALSFVDCVFIFDGPELTREISAIAPDVYTKGADYSLETLNPREKEALMGVGCRIKLIPHRSGYSTTETIFRFKEKA